MQQLMPYRKRWRCCCSSKWFVANRSISFKNNINLYLATGATLLFTKDFDQYPLVKANWEGLPQMRNQSPISATDATNIAITGKGIIDGNGDAWRMVKR